MPTQIIIDSQKFFNQLKNGKTYGSNLTDYTVNLVGSIGERIRVETELSVYCHAITIAKPWDLSTGSYCMFTYIDALKQLLRNTGDFIQDGLSVGDTVSIWHMDTGGVYHGPYYGTIASLSATQIIFISSPIDSGSVALTDGGRQWMDVVVTTWLTALIFKFGLIGNNETFNDISKISLNDQAFYGSGIGADDGYGNRITTPIPLTKLGNYEDWITGPYEDYVKYNATAAWVATNTDLWQQFKITHEFIISPWYLKEWEQNLIDGTIPTLLAGLDSFKYAINTEFRSVLSNPNTSKIATNDNILGCVAYFNENFNGFNNFFHIDSIVYTDSATGGSVSGIQLTKKTKAVITLSQMGGSFTSGDPCGLFVSYCPDDISEYQNKYTTAEENFVYDNAINDEGAASIAGDNGIIKTFVAHIVSGKLIITAEFQYTTPQILIMANTPKIMIGVLIANDSKSAANSDKVMLLGGYGDVVTNPDIPNLLQFGDACTIYRHDYIHSLQHTLFDEDGVVVHYNFSLNYSLSAILKSLDFVTAAYDSVNDTYFVLDKRSINVSNAPVVGGIQQFNINIGRGYQLDSSDYFNKIVLVNNGNGATWADFILDIGQKIKWQDWIQNLNADPDFYDSLKLNNNLNFKSDSYCLIQSGNTDYSIRFLLIAKIEGKDSNGITGTTIYKGISAEQFIYDYNKPATYWTAQIETFDKTGSINLGGGILYNDYTLFRTTFKFYTTIDPSYKIWSIHRIEEHYENGDNIFEHSTLYDRINDAPFADQTGATSLRLKQTVNLSTNQVITEDLIDYTKLDQNKTYKLSARICYDTPSTPYANYYETEAGDTYITEAGDTYITE